MTFYNFLLLNNFFRKKAPLSVLKVFLQSGNQLLLKIDYGKSKRRTIFFEYKKQEKHSSRFIDTPLSIKFFYVAYFFFLRCLSFFLRCLSFFSRNDINPYLPPFILRANQPITFFIIHRFSRIKILCRPTIVSPIGNN